MPNKTREQEKEELRKRIEAIETEELEEDTPIPHYDDEKWEGYMETIIRKQNQLMIIGAITMACVICWIGLLFLL